MFPVEVELAVKEEMCAFNEINKDLVKHDSSRREETNHSKLAQHQAQWSCRCDFLLACPPLLCTVASRKYYINRFDRFDPTTLKIHTH